MKIKVDIVYLPVYVILEDDQSSPFVELENVHPQQVKYLKNKSKDFWKSQEWLQEAYNEALRNS